MTEPPVTFDDFTKNLKESLAIMICEEDRTERIAAACIASSNSNLSGRAMGRG